MPVQLPTSIKPEHLEGIAKHIAESADALRAQAEIMRDVGLETMDVFAWQQTATGMRFIDSFLSTVRDAIAQAKADRGDIPPLPETIRKRRGKAVPGKNGKRTEK